MQSDQKEIKLIKRALSNLRSQLNRTLDEIGSRIDRLETDEGADPYRLGNTDWSKEVDAWMEDGSAGG